LLTLIRRVRTRCVLADAGWMFVMVGFVVAVAFAVMAITLRLVPMTISMRTAVVAIAAAVILPVLIGLVRRWPSEARIARKIDQALELRELLATGYASIGDDDASRLVRAYAVEKARGIRPGDVPISVPSANSFVAAVLLLVASVTANALIQPSTADDTAIQPTRPNRTPAGLMDHDAAAHTAPKASAKQPEPESGKSMMPAESPAPVTPAVKSSDASNGKTNDGDGRDRGTSDATRADTELTFSVSSGAKKDVKPDDVHSSATGGTPTDGSASASSNDIRAGASSPRIPDRGAPGSDHTAVNESSPSRAVARIPDRHRDLVRAYFDAAATRPSDAKR
jgi:hypothetical protein